MKKTKAIYLDHAATTPVDPVVLKAMQPFFSEHYGNPSALYKAGLIANGAINDARRSIANILHTQPDTLIFTSGGTEANNLALLGVAQANQKAGKHIISTAIEHDAILNPLEALREQGYDITYIKTDHNGSVKPTDVIAAIRPDTVLISLMYANNEIGTIEPVAEIGRQLLRYRKEKNTALPYLHTDACQATGYLDLDVEKLHVDLLTLNGSKMYGPKGAGLLYVRRGVAIRPQNYGGSQERGLRAGTENVPGIVGLAMALEMAQKNRDKESKRQRKLTESLLKKVVTIKTKEGTIALNGPMVGEGRLPNNLNLLVPGIDGEALVIYLDSLGIMCATGSACTAVSREPSHVLRAIGRSEKEILSSIRVTIGKNTTKADLDAFLTGLKKSLALLQ